MGGGDNQRVTYGIVCIHGSYMHNLGAKVRKKIDTRKREGFFFESKVKSRKSKARRLENLEILDRYATPERGK